MPTNTDSFKDNIRQRFPEGLTGIFAIGATRRTYILEKQRHMEDPGNIRDFADMGAYLHDRYLQFCEMFFRLGGQNMIITALSYRSFFERGPEYATRVVPEALRLIDESSDTFYHNNEVDPVFIGLEILQQESAPSAARRLADDLNDYMAKWQYSHDRRKLVWEIASVPLLTLRALTLAMPPDETAEIEAKIAEAEGLAEIQSLLYRTYCEKVFGWSMPMPQFYLGTNMAGDLKLRAPMPLALTAGEYLRAYYTPYPTLFMSEAAMRSMLTDLAFQERLHAPTSVDYSGKYDEHLAEAEYARIQALAADPKNIIGLTRRVNGKIDD